MNVEPQKQLPMMIVGGMVAGFLAYPSVVGMFVFAGIGALITGLVLVTEDWRKS